VPRKGLISYRMVLQESQGMSHATIWEKSFQAERTARTKPLSQEHLFDKDILAVWE